MIEAVPAAGGGLWVRLRVRFGPRLSEWMLGGITVGWGLVGVLNTDLFKQPGYAGFRPIFGDSLLLGIVMLMLGTARLGGLFVNGSRRDVTPWIRVTSAGVGMLIWVGMTTAYALSGVLGVWAAIYPVFALVEVINAYRASRDAGESNGLT